MTGWQDDCPHCDHPVDVHDAIGCMWDVFDESPLPYRCRCYRDHESLTPPADELIDTEPGDRR